MIIVQMTPHFADTVAKLLPVLGITAVVEMRALRLAFRFRHDRAAILGLRVATTLWGATIIVLLLAEAHCLQWLAVDHNTDPAVGLALTLYWIILATLALLVVLPGFFNLARAFGSRNEGTDII